MARFKNVNWNVWERAGGEVGSTEGAILAVLMDIRDELQYLNVTMEPLRCPNFTNIPAILQLIRRNTTKKRRKK